MDIKQLVSLITDDALILTPNLRLARTLHKNYQSHCLERSLTTWQSPNILSYTHFVDQIWQTLADSPHFALPYVLSNEQARYLWERVILESDQGQGLLNSTQTSQYAAQAWEFLAQWQYPYMSLESCHEPDVAAFYRWAKRFDEVMKQKGFMTAAECGNEILNDIPAIQATLLSYKTIHLVGFESFTPQQQALIALLEQHCSVTSHALAQDTSECVRVACHDVQDEMRAMVQFALDQLAEGKESIACVVPMLQAERQNLVRLFAEAFCQDDENASQVNISGGDVFADVPVIAAALQIIHCRYPVWSTHAFLNLIRTPFLGAAETEYQARAELDVILRDTGSESLQAHHIMKAIAENDLACPELLKLLQALQLTLAAEPLQKKGVPEKKAVSHWLNAFQSQLKQFGWPGERPLNSTEYQAVKRWQDMLADLHALERVAEPMTFDGAFSLLKYTANQTLFQIQTPDAPIQVLGVLEAAGMCFDALWIMGLNDQRWPAAAAPNPLLPRLLQRELNMPHASAERELAFSQGLTQQFSTAAHHVVMSYSSFEKDSPLTPSPLITAFPVKAYAHTQKKSVAEQIRKTQKLESYYENLGPALLDDEPIRGGTAILKDQALCPFRAFAHYRLHAFGLSGLEDGVTALDRGSLIHNALEIFWKDVTSHENLCALDDDVLAEKVHHAIEISTQDYQRSKLIPIETDIAALMKKNLFSLLLEWIKGERERPPFTVVGTESPLQYQLNKLTIRMRIDRMDRDVYGNLIIIDYKTGRTRLYDSFSERLCEPQLALYALSEPGSTAIAYGKVRFDEMQWQGVSANDCDMKGMVAIGEYRYSQHAVWEDQLARWQEQCETLAEEFCIGFAAVQPDDGMACQTCDLQALCRIDELENASHPLLKREYANEGEMP